MSPRRCPWFRGEYDDQKSDRKKSDYDGVDVMVDPGTDASSVRRRFCDRRVRNLSFCHPGRRIHRARCPVQSPLRCAHDDVRSGKRPYRGYGCTANGCRRISSKRISLAWPHYIRLGDLVRRRDFRRHDTSSYVRLGGREYWFNDSSVHPDC